MFCEECGARLEAGIRFCENCGTPVPQDAVQESAKSESTCCSLFSFSDADWKAGYKRYGEHAAARGVIVTSLCRLAAQLHAPRERLLQTIGAYVAFCAADGVAYALLDMDDQRVVSSDAVSVKNVVAALSAIKAAAETKYVLILGNERVISVAEWENESRDGDKTVTSDLCYSALCATSPWDGMHYVFSDVLRVGRLPSYEGESFEQFTAYFTLVMRNKQPFPSLSPYGLSALVWKKESDYEYKRIASGTTDAAPDVTVSTVQDHMHADTNVLFFNLHGSDQTKYWYGQDGSSYPEAFAPQNLQAVSVPFILGVEACYGAKFVGNLTEDDSVLMKALQSGCVALLGSSKIAYGTASPPGSCADLVVGEFLQQMCAGKTAGDAHVLGLKRLVEETKSFDDAEIKTMAEFALYGDPSRSVVGGETSRQKSLFGTGMSRSIRVDIPDIRKAVRLSLAHVDEKIAARVNAYVYERFSRLKGVAPVTYRVEGKDLYQSLYTVSSQTLPQTVKVYFDRNGTITKELESK